MAKQLNYFSRMVVKFAKIVRESPGEHQISWMGFFDDVSKLGTWKIKLK